MKIKFYIGDKLILSSDKFAESHADLVKKFGGYEYAEIEGRKHSFEDLVAFYNTAATFSEEDLDILANDEDIFARWEEGE